MPPASKTAIQQTVLDGFGEVVFGDVFYALYIGNGAGDTADFVEGAGAQAHFIHRLLHEEQA